MLQKIKGQTALARKIRKSINYTKRYKVDGTNIPALIVKERIKEVEALNNLIGEHQQKLKGMQK